MRIFVVCADRGVPLDGTKGASVHLRSLVRALHRAGHEVTLFVESPIPEVPGDLPLPARRIRPTRQLIDEARRAGSPDLVYERYSLGHRDGLRAARTLSVPFALEVNAPLVLEASRHRPDGLRPRDEETERLLFREADVVLAVSEPLRAYAEVLRGSAEGTSVLRNGFDPGRFPVPATLEEPVLAFLGHPKPWHGAGRLPGMLAGLHSGGRDARLLLIGGGKGADRILAVAEERGVAGAVEVTGPVSASEAAERLVEASVGLAPYPQERFFYFCPLKVIEYMAAGIPVVAPAQGDIPEIVGDGGILVPADGEDAFTAAVARLLDEPALRSRLGTAGRRRAFQSFTWDAVVDRLLRTVASCVSGGRGMSSVPLPDGRGARERPVGYAS